MDRKERTASIVRALDGCAMRFCERTGGAYFELESEYKGREEAENLRYRRAYIFYNSFLVEFKYTAHATMGVVNSILECMIHIDKNKDGMRIPLALFLDYCDVGTAQPLCIPGILDAEGMNEAFGIISGVLEDNMQNITSALEDRGRIERQFFAEVSAMMYNTAVDESNAEFYVDDGLYSLFTLRLCSAAFINYIKGDIQTAVKQLGKVKGKLGYEKRTLELWERGDVADLSGALNVRAGLESYNKSGVAITSNKETAVVFLSWLILTVPFSAIYLALFFLLYAFESIGAVYLMGPIYNFPYCILAGFLSAIAASYFTRFKFYKLLFRKDYERLRAADQVNNGKGADKLIKWMLRIIVVCSLVGTVLFTRWGLKFTDDGFVDNTDFFAVSGQYYEYEDIERVYYLPDRVNGFGETLDYPSYVLVLKGGREIDLYEYGETEEYEQKLIDHLREKGVRVDKHEK